MADKQGWPVHAQAAWEHEKRRGDRLYQALCDMERQRDDALRALASRGAAMGSSMESTIEKPHSAALLTSEGPAQRPETPTVGTCATCKHWCAETWQHESRDYFAREGKDAACGKKREIRGMFTIYIYGDGRVDDYEFDTPPTFGCTLNEPAPTGGKA